MLKDKSILWWVCFVLMAIWQLPQTLVALIMMPFLGKLTLIDTHKFTLCFQGERMHGGISLGNFAFVSKIGAKYKTTIAHEMKGHPWDSYRMGPLYLFIIGIPSILNAEFDFTDCYFDWYTERWANNHAGLTVDENCRLIFKEKEA